MECRPRQQKLALMKLQYMAPNQTCWSYVASLIEWVTSRNPYLTRSGPSWLHRDTELLTGVTRGV
jgi:hypothetical protein